MRLVTMITLLSVVTSAAALGAEERQGPANAERAADAFTEIRIEAAEHSQTMYCSLDRLNLVGDRQRLARLDGEALSRVEGSLELTDDQHVLLRRSEPVADLAELQRWMDRAGVLPGVERVEPLMSSAPNGLIEPQPVDGSLTVVLQPGVDADRFCVDNQLELVRQSPYFDRHLVVRPQRGDAFAGFAAVRPLAKLAEVSHIGPRLPVQLTYWATPDDPLFSSQWHLAGSPAAMNVTGAWDNFRGEGVVIAINDDGVDTAHEDLAPNYSAALSFDYGQGDSDPSPVEEDDNHGTVVASCAAARGDNGIGVSGVAPEATIAAVRNVLTDESLAAGLRHGVANGTVHISNNSWGFVGFGFQVFPPDPALQAAITDGYLNGRGGRGVVYVFAAGNNGNLDFGSGPFDDGTDYDGQLNRFVITVGALARTGRKASYSEAGNNLFVCAGGGDDDSGGTPGNIVSADRSGAPGYVNDNYINAGEYPMAGTSFASPNVAGGIALMLEARPELTVRDVMHVIADTSRVVDSGDAGWITNASGRTFNRKYGFGLMDVSAAVQRAQTMPLVPPQEPVRASISSSGQIPIGENLDAAATDSVTIAGPAGFFTEHVELTVRISHENRGELEYRLTSPSGTTHVIPDRQRTDSTADLDFTFTLNGFWGEEGSGDWVLSVVDRKSGITGTLNNWSLRVYGFTGIPEPGLDKVITNATQTAMVHVFDTEIVLTVYGSGFVQPEGGSLGSVVHWNGTPLATTWISDTELTAVVPDSLLTVLGDADITVVNGEEITDPLPVHVVPQQPMIISDPVLVAPVGGAWSNTVTTSTSLLANPSLSYQVVANSPEIIVTLSGSTLNWNLVSSPPNGNHAYARVRVTDTGTGSFDEQHFVIRAAPPSSITDASLKGGD